jgi:hypothetical protein
VDCEADEETAHRIDRDVIYRGLRRFYDGDTSGGAAGPYVFAHMIRLAILKPGDDRIDFDADDASDVIVQAGLFGRSCTADGTPTSPTTSSSTDTRTSTTTPWQSSGTPMPTSP